MTKSDSKVDGPSPVSRKFGPVASGGADAYERERDLPKLMPLYCQNYDIEDYSELSTQRIVVRLSNLVDETLDKYVSGFWVCKLRRLIAVVSALKAEKRNLAVIVARQAAALSAATAEDGMAGKGSRPTDASEPRVAHSRETRGTA